MFLRGSDERNHDLRLHLPSLLLDVAGSLKNGAALHFGNLRIDDAKPASPVAEHRIELVELLHAIQQFFFLGDFRQRRVLCLEQRHFNHEFFALGKELVKRRIEKTNRHRQAVHDAKQTFEIGALERQ